MREPALTRMVEVVAFDCEKRTGERSPMAINFLMRKRRYILPPVVKRRKAMAIIAPAVFSVTGLFSLSSEVKMTTAKVTRRAAALRAPETLSSLP